MNTNIQRPQKTKRPGADRRWTLLFIGDHGNMITLKHFKAIVIGIGFLFIVAVVLAVVLFFQNQGTLNLNKALQKRFSDSEKQIEKLRHEKEILMARLVRAEARLKENAAPELQIQPKSEPPNTSAPAPPLAQKPKPAKVVEKKPAAVQATPPKPEPAETIEAEPVISVAVENFKVSRDGGPKNLNAQFKIKNTSPTPQRVSGRVVIVLKGDNLQVDQWLVMPAVGLVIDRPSGKRGKLFSIQRFRTMNLVSRAPNYSDQFQTAAVYVFTKTGELLLEQEFSVEVPPAPPAAAVKASTPKAPEAEPFTPTASEEKPFSPTVSEEKPSSPKPGGEAPESGDASDPMEGVPSVW